MSNVKNIIFFSFFFIGIVITSAQNLVDNSSFEESSECPEFQGDFFATEWNTVPTGVVSSPDYFKDCAPVDSQAGVPDNIAGTQEPENGNAYVGVFTYGNDSAQREYIQTQLNIPLIEGAIYRVSFYVSLPDRFRLASDGIGALLTVDPIEGDETSGVIDMEPQVLADFIVTDRQNWTLITGTYTANGGEEYLTLGNFFFDEETQTQKLPPPGEFLNWTFYYIDSVSVIDVTLSIEEESLENQIKIYPNPVGDQLKIEISNELIIDTFTLYSLQGQIVISGKMNTINGDLDMSGFSSGIYFLEFIDDDGNRYIRQLRKK